ncbi:hypothetical protein DUNSADRAFT_7584 [Dunaliella salina]|uniref:Uncharacterized protein n=1 Tax=Dunaliella salina TaxID=3046 RepID=A0ABQ7GL18_DUNSA|nr:hypothetical protein DUNSADRAFT_7584 [Dunaliella salina]|eukprot:KAF5835304.1 hypothetical protein DUNSADRAFT_7584 [Dunaliella salina]
MCGLCWRTHLDMFWTASPTWPPSSHPMRPCWRSRARLCLLRSRTCWAWGAWQARTHCQETLWGRSLPFDEPYVLDLRCLAEADASEVEASRAAEAEEAPGALVASGRGQVARLQGAGGQQLSANNAAEYLQLVRSFKGLEAPVAGAAPKAPTAAVEGQRGRAAVYRDEGLQ